MTATGPVSLADECTRIYVPTGKVAHLRTPWASHGQPLCPADPAWAWRGTGSQEEYEHAATLPLCKRCAAMAEASDKPSGAVLRGAGK